MSRHIPSEGPHNATIAFVGEAPGADEDRIGRPFVGASGVQFERLLETVGLHRSQCYITNVAKVRPHANNFDQLATRNTRGVITTTLQYDLYERSLYEELAGVSANVIVPLDNWALHALTRKWGVEKWRGSQLAAVPELGGRKVIPTFHPMFTLREFLAQYPLKLDLARIKRHSEFPELRLPQRTLRIFPSFSDVVAYFDAAMSQREVGFDIEVKPCGGTRKEPHTYEMTCFSIALSGNDSMCVPILGPGGYYWPEAQHLAVMTRLAAFLESPNVLKVGQNLNFDASFMLRKHSVGCAPIFDTMIAQRLILTDLPIGLDFITSIYTEEPYYKDEGKQWDSPSNWADFYLYSARDSAICMEVKPKQEADLARACNTQTYERTIASMPAIAFMQERGVRSDEETIAKLKASVQADLSDKIGPLLTLVRSHGTTYLGRGKTPKLKEFDEKFPTSPDQCKAYFYTTRNFPPYRNRDGGVTTDDEALTRLARKGVEEASMVLAYREQHKLMTSYLDAKLDAGRFRCQFKPVGAATGRMSSAADIFGYGLNLQTIPREGLFKQMFLPDTGYLMMQIDLSQAEARILSYCGNVTPKIEAYENGIDVYCVTASRIAQRLGYSLTHDEILAQHEAKIMAPIAGGKKSWRGWGKECDLALGYGMGADRFSRRTGMLLADSKLVRGAWHLVYPEVQSGYWSMIDSMLAANRTVTNPFGRRRKFLGPRDDIREAAYAHFCQSTVADAIMQNALVPLAMRQDLFAPVELLLQIHDAVVFQVPLSLGFYRIASIVTALKTFMEKPIEWHGRKFVVPASVSVSGVSLGHCVEIGSGQISAADIEKAYFKSESKREKVA